MELVGKIRHIKNLWFALLVASRISVWWRFQRKNQNDRLFNVDSVSRLKIKGQDKAVFICFEKKKKKNRKKTNENRKFKTDNKK